MRGSLENALEIPTCRSTTTAASAEAKKAMSGSSALWVPSCPRVPCVAEDIPCKNGRL